MYVSVEAPNVIPSIEAHPSTSRSQNQTTVSSAEFPENELKELDDWKTAYESLKLEVERLKQPDESQASMRAISLSILQNQIESVLDGNEIGLWKGRLQKAEMALSEERQRSIELERQLNLLSKSQQSIISTMSRLKQSEQELSDLRKANEEVKVQFEVLNAQKQQLVITADNLKAALDQERERVQELTLENAKLMAEGSKRESEMKESMESALRDHHRAEERVLHLEKLLLKLTEDNTPEEEIKDGVETSDPTIPKQLTSLPDPPSVEEPPVHSPSPTKYLENQIMDGDTTRLEEEQREDKPNNEQDDLENEQIRALEDSSVVKHVQEGALEVVEEASENNDQGWRQRVSSFWGYVTGEAT